MMAVEYTHGSIYLGLLHADKSFTFCSKPIAKILKSKDFKIQITPSSLKLSTKGYDQNVQGLDMNYFINSFTFIKNVNGQLIVPNTSQFSDILSDCVKFYVAYK
jgi:hypothetical protein